MTAARVPLPHWRTQSRPYRHPSLAVHGSAYFAAFARSANKRLIAGRKFERNVKDHLSIYKISIYKDLLELNVFRVIICAARKEYRSKRISKSKQENIRGSAYYHAKHIQFQEWFYHMVIGGSETGGRLRCARALAKQF